MRPSFSAAAIAEAIRECMDLTRATSDARRAQSGLHTGENRRHQAADDRLVEKAATSRELPGTAGRAVQLRRSSNPGLRGERGYPSRGTSRAQAWRRKRAHRLLGVRRPGCGGVGVGRSFQGLACGCGPV